MIFLRTPERAGVKNSKDISLLYAYDIERREPVCAGVFPGNRPDTSAYPEFIRTNDIRDAIIIDDTGVLCCVNQR